MRHCDDLFEGERGVAVLDCDCSEQATEDEMGFKKEANACVASWRVCLNFSLRKFPLDNFVKYRLSGLYEAPIDYFLDL
jgi:hypothetical protein